MLYKTLINKKTIYSNHNLEEVKKILIEEWHLSDSYTWWKPFKKDIYQFVGILKGNWFEIRPNSHYLAFGWNNDNIKTSGNLMWKLEGTINSHGDKSSIDLKMKYTRFTQFNSWYLYLLPFIGSLNSNH